MKHPYAEIGRKADGIAHVWCYDHPSGCGNRGGVLVCHLDLRGTPSLSWYDLWFTMLDDEDRKAAAQKIVEFLTQEHIAKRLTS